MSIPKGLATLTVALLLLSACATPEPAQKTAAGDAGSRPALDILEGYRTLPADYFSCEPGLEIGIDERMARIESQDLQENYILAAVEGHPLEVKQFHDADGAPAFVAVILSCGPGCACEKTEFLRRDDGGSWVEASVKMSVSEMTEAYEARVAEAHGRQLYPRFKLPEHGTTIRVQDWETGLPIYDLDWTGAGFEVRTIQGGIPEDWGSGTAKVGER